MNAQEIRKAYLEFFKKRGHTVIPRARIVPENDPTTLFTGSGMQPLIPYLLGEKHPSGNKLVDSQTCFRAEDIDEVGDNRHTTFFEMLGNWSLGDYFKKEQLPWFFEFLTDKAGIDPNKLYVTVFIGDPKNNVPKDTEAAEIWQNLFKNKGIDAKDADIGSEDDGYKRGIKEGERIFYYDDKNNWWNRGEKGINITPVGEPCGPSSEVFYDFGTPHDKSFGENCHPNCDCGRFLEIGNSVFMTYEKREKEVKPLKAPNVDFGGGLERIAAASIDSADMFKIDLMWPIIEQLQKLSGKKYEDHVEAKRIIADHMRSAVFMAADGVTPSNKTQGYILRRLLRRAIRHGLDLGIENGLLENVADTILNMYKDDYPELLKDKDIVISVLAREEKAFRQTLRKGLKMFDNITSQKFALKGGNIMHDTKDHYEVTKNGEYKSVLFGDEIFKLFDTYGFPPELSIEEAKKRDIKLDENWEDIYEEELKKQRNRSRSAAAGLFKGGLAEHSEQTIKYHTATHLMYKALRLTLGDHVEQRGSNITNERLRFDFNHPAKVTPEEIKKVEDIVNEQIDKDLPVTWEEMPTDKALKTGARGHFGEKYGDTVKVYIMGPKANPYTMELCGGPHVEHTGTLGEGNKKFKIIKEESSSAGIRRIKAVLQ